VPKELDARAAPVFARKYGLLTGEQGRSLGFTRDAIRHRVATCIWVRVLPGVYRLAAVPQSWKQRLLAACLWSGSGVASHRSAGALYGFDGFRAGLIEITAGLNAAPARTGIVLHRSGQLGPADRTRLHGIPVTTVARTLVDLGAVSPR
jgi:predicted transcriptional regulator of viral defense system